MNTQKLLAFRNLAPERTVEIRGVSWRYRTLGEGPAVLALPGAIGDGELAFPVLMALARHRRVIAPAYPPVHTMRAMTDGLSALLEGEGIDRADVIGGSYGGLVAQVMARTHPRLVRSLVLSHTGIPRASRARSNMRVITIVNVLPMPVIRWLLRRVVSMVVRPAGASRAFWYEQSVRAVNAMSRADVVAGYARAVDLDLNYAFRAGEVDVPVLLIAATDDRVAKAQVPLLRRLYPAAEVKMFDGTGHATALVVPDEFGAVVEGFLDRYTPVHERTRDHVARP